MFTRIHGALADDEALDVLGAVVDACRTLQQELQGSPDEREQRLGALGEWAVLTVLSRSGVAPPLYPAATTTESAPAPVSPRFRAGLLARPVGEFVGRRREQRYWPVELVDPGVAGLVLHGIGGVGKTMLAAELTRRVVEREPERLVVLASGVTVGGVLSVDQGARCPRRWVRRAAPGVLDDVPMLLVLDNFEDNLAYHAAGDTRAGGR